MSKTLLKQCLFVVSIIDKKIILERTYSLMKRNIYLMYAIGLLQGMVFYGPIATLYRQVQGVSIFQITLIESISLILCILFEIPWGIIADKIGYRKTMIFCCSLYFISKIVFWQATGFIWFLIERIMLSIVLAGFSGVDSSILYLSCEKEDSQKVFGIYNSLGMIGLLFAAVVFSLLVKENYPLAALLTVISYGLAALSSFFLIEVKSAKSKQTSTDQFKEILYQTLRNKHLLLFLLFAAFLSETHQTITVFLNQLQYEKCGLGNSAIGYIYILATLIGTCGVFSAHFTKKLGIKMTGILLGSAAIASCIMLVIAKSAGLSICGILLLRISNSLFGPFQTKIQNEQIHTANRATALSIHAMLIDSVAIGTNLLFGFLAEKNLAMSYCFGAMICLVGILFFIIWYRATVKQTPSTD